MQGAVAGVPWSIEHSTVAPASAVKPNDGVASFVGPDGPESIDNDGAVRVDREAASCVGRVAGGVGRPDPEGVVAVGQRRRPAGGRGARAGAEAGAGGRSSTRPPRPRSA